VGGVEWPLCVPPTVERDRRAWPCLFTQTVTTGDDTLGNA